MYIPKEDDSTPWGTLSGAKLALKKRNQRIYNEYKEGKGINELAEEFFISVDSFFAKHIEFSYNTKMVEQTTRILKMLLRHPDSIGELADKVGEQYTFSVFGARRTYTIVFTTTDQSIVLTDIW